MKRYEALASCEGGGGGEGGAGDGEGGRRAGPMAAHLLRWWRTKFSQGCKHFSVLAEGERTDTEELVGRAPSQCSAPPDLLPSEAKALLAPPEQQQQQQHQQHQHRHRSEASPSPSQSPTATPPQASDRLRFEEFTCDVQVRGRSSPSGAQPLHFSFTLYDFDGHGRITKDDIAGIVSTIYESFGKNVTVPHYGSKTIQVHLTVSPDQKKNGEDETPSPNTPQGGDHKVRFKRDLNNHVREGRRKPRRKVTTELIPLVPQTSKETDNVAQAIPEVNEERRSRLSVDDDVSECSETHRTPKSFKRNLRRQYQKNNLSPRYRNPQNNLCHRNDIWNCQKENVLPSAGCLSNSDQLSGPRDSASVDGSRVRSSTKKRSGSLQRRELLEIIQANMEKNHLSFQTSRKQYPDSRMIGSFEGESVNSKSRHRGRSNTFTSKRAFEHNLNTNVEYPNNRYLDLASTNVQAQHKESNICRYDSFLHAVICSSSQHAKTSVHPKTVNPVQLQKPWRSHHRSRSHDMAQAPFRYTLLEPYENTVTDVLQESAKNTEARAKSFEYCKEQDVNYRLNISSECKNKTDLTKKSINNRKPAAAVHNCSLHHLKHQNREKYHARAMAQVEKWLENDNNTRLMKNAKKKWTAEQDCSKIDNLTANIDNINDSLEWKGLLRGSEGEGDECNEGSTVHHRYVHEHIHHHYHHFEDKLPSTNTVVV